MAGFGRVCSLFSTRAHANGANFYLNLLTNSHLWPALGRRSIQCSDNFFHCMVFRLQFSVDGGFDTGVIAFFSDVARLRRSAEYF
jgi:hypothetical protein